MNKILPNQTVNIEEGSEGTGGLSRRELLMGVVASTVFGIFNFPKESFAGEMSKKTIGVNYDELLDKKMRTFPKEMPGIFRKIEADLFKNPDATPDAVKEIVLGFIDELSKGEITNLTREIIIENSPDSRRNIIKAYENDTKKDKKMIKIFSGI